MHRCREIRMEKLKCELGFVSVVLGLGVVFLLGYVMGSVGLGNFFNF